MAVLSGWHLRLFHNNLSRLRLEHNFFFSATDYEEAKPADPSLGALRALRKNRIDTEFNFASSAGGVCGVCGSCFSHDC